MQCHRRSTRAEPKALHESNQSTPTAEDPSIIITINTIISYYCLLLMIIAILNYYSCLYYCVGTADTDTP